MVGLGLFPRHRTCFQHVRAKHKVRRKPLVHASLLPHWVLLWTRHHPSWLAARSVHLLFASWAHISASQPSRLTFLREAGSSLQKVKKTEKNLELLTEETCDLRLRCKCQSPTRLTSGETHQTASLSRCLSVHVHSAQPQRCRKTALTVPHGVSSVAVTFRWQRV